MPIMKSYLVLLFLVGCAGTVTKTPEKPPYNGSYYKVESTLEWVKEVAQIADCVTNNTEFHQEIASYPKYEHYDGESSKIVTDLLSDKKAIVGTYYKKFTKARAYRNVGSDKIWLNRAKLGNVDSGLNNTMIHERLHVLGYGHKGNKKFQYNNVESVPYKVGKFSEKYVEKCKPRKTK